MTEVKSFREVALSFSQQKVTAMVAKIEAAFERRDDFESGNKVSLIADNSYTRERKRMLANKVAVARFFLALGIEPSAVIERKVAETSMFNAKALKKVTELARFSCGVGERLERVMRAFIACAIVAADKNVTTLNNKVNVRFLGSSDLRAALSDQDLIDHLDDLRYKVMTSGAETQSSQARNVLDVLGLGVIRSTDKPRDAIEINSQHAFYSDFRSAFMK